MRILAGVLTGLIFCYQIFSPTALSATETTDTPTEAESQLSEEALVETLHEGLLAIMQGGAGMGFEGRFELISPIVEETFDVTALAASSIGLPIWRTWETEQKKTYVGAFRRFLNSNYASQFKSFSGQSFVTVSVEDGPRRTKIVKTELIRPDDDPVSLDYLVKKRLRKIGIVDVFLDGTISEAGRRRADFGSVYRDQGFNGLVQNINDLSDNLAKPDSPDIGDDLEETESTSDTADQS